jgi:hypothetical protein
MTINEECIVKMFVTLAQIFEHKVKTGGRYAIVDYDTHQDAALAR